jgi:hypothetical protein
MTEADWLACEDPTPMLEFLRSEASARKLRLFCVACFSLVRSYDADDGTRLLNGPTIEFVARFADGLASIEEMRSVWRTRGFSATVPSPEQPFEWAGAYLHRAVREEELRRRLGLEAEPKKYPSPQELIPPLCDVFGNPFRPVVFDPEWLTSTVVALAGQMYESRDFSAMPILADALQDAGCNRDEALNHCRGDGPHARGCWVVDLLLGKE